MASEQKDLNAARPGGIKAAAAMRARVGGSVQGEVGSALRSAYEQTVSENIPAEMLDLLGRLA